MAKRSKAQTELTIQQIMDEAFRQILTIGFETMSYSTLADALGISRTGVSHHFPRKLDFLLRLNERIGEHFISALDFSSNEALQYSWEQAMTRPEQQAVLRLFFSICGRIEDEMPEFIAVEQALQQAEAALGLAGRELVQELLGASALQLSSGNSLAKAA
ncbi:TetR family transcriptional regulator [Shewanella dokdonensis]|uniref:TetR family transcriptional regulator n=1 Tax=Shewanella dokdonensis TaxID=712036 RepID=A0ABX8DH03_9GAMM|nr:TetR family transcriptional regulator [Shewanella dokdonensis]MCL1074351.1 TetR family transcriptional regulator [Shewanella dokdonensis]QVK24038.1 TetR family transcriptional regulator [Shewanella dokdonensis]